MKRHHKEVDENTLLLLHAEDFTDSSIYNNIIVNYNDYATLYASGKFGSAFDFNKSGSYLRINNVSIPANFSLDFWMYKTSATTCSILSVGEGAIDITSMDDGRLRINPMWGTPLVYTEVIPTNTWVHVYVEVINRVMKAYVSGKLSVTQNLSLSQKSGAYIGNHFSEPRNYYFRGYIDEFRISNISRWQTNFTPPTQPY